MPRPKPRVILNVEGVEERIVPSPPGATGVPDLRSADDTGVSSSDNVTIQTTG